MAADDAERWARKVERHLRRPGALRDFLAWPVPPDEEHDPELRAALADPAAGLHRRRPAVRVRRSARPGAAGLPALVPRPVRRSAGVQVVCGHWAALGCHREAGVVALDSGAAWGGRLSALRLEDGEHFQRPVTETRRF